MGRLIDADNLVFNGRQYNSSQMKTILDFVDAQPTAYDTDKVVEQLEDRKSLMLETFKISESDIDRGRIYGMDKAIEIVKAGGTDDIDTCAWMKGQGRRKKIKRERDKIGETNRRAEKEKAAGERSKERVPAKL